MSAERRCGTGRNFGLNLEHLDELKAAGMVVSGIDSEPKGVQKPHVPIWVGGDSPPAIRRAVAFGDGWVPMTGTVRDLAQKGDWIREQLAAAGRDPLNYDFSYSLAVGERDSYTPAPGSSDVHHRGQSTSPMPVVPYDPGSVIESIGNLHEAGFNHNFIRFNWKDPDDLMRHMEWFASKVMPAFQN